MRGVFLSSEYPRLAAAHNALMLATATPSVPHRHPPDGAEEYTRPCSSSTHRLGSTTGTMCTQWSARVNIDEQTIDHGAWAANGTPKSDCGHWGSGYPNPMEPIPLDPVERCRRALVRHLR